MTEDISGGELAIRTLLRARVTNIFALYGGHLEALFQSCREHQLPVLDVRHEASAGHAAEGFARASRSLGVAFATAGPGFTNVVTSIANAYLDRTPVLYVIASTFQSHAERNMMQSGFDQIAVARPITKWAHRVTVVTDIPRLIAQAIRIATTAPTGPVMIELPFDVSLARAPETSVEIPPTKPFDQPTLPHPAAIEAALALLAEARRPIIMAGEGAWWSGAGPALRRFAEANGVPVFTDYTTLGMLPEDHPLDGGVFYRLTELAETQRPDVVLALGVRFGVFTLGGRGPLLPADVRLIHVEADRTEVGRLITPDVSIVADVREALEALNDCAARAGDWRAWRKTVADAKALRRRRFSNLAERTSRPIHPYQAAAAVVAAAGPEAIYLGDGAEAHHWAVEAMRQVAPGRFFTHGMLGATGCGAGLAIGVQVADPHRRVILITGDGAVGFNIAEFDTMVRHNLPIVTVVMNNRSWGATKRFQDIISGAGKNIAVALGDARYDEVAKGFGAHGEYVTEPGELALAMQRALDSGKPACVNVEIELADMPPESEALMSAG